MGTEIEIKTLEAEIFGPPNGARDVVCFACLNHRSLDGIVDRSGGWFYHQSCCAKGRTQPALEDGVSETDVMMRCPDVAPRLGFQIGGFYSHTWFEDGEPVPCPEPCGAHDCATGGCRKDSSCMDLIIGSDGEFPVDGEGIRLHLCNWHQVERWVEFWGKELRRRGWVRDEAVSGQCPPGNSGHREE